MLSDFLYKSLAKLFDFIRNMFEKLVPVAFWLVTICNKIIYTLLFVIFSHVML